jgi:hypothetical protein
MTARTSAFVVAAIAGTLSLGSPLNAQRRVGANTGEKPKVDVVQTVGCAEHRDGTPGTWWLARAADAATAQPGIFNTTQIDAAKARPAGANTFQLVGVADFLDTEGLLNSGQRREFTTPETANATGELRAGARVLVKGMLVVDGEAKRINLLAVIRLADSCN